MSRLKFASVLLILSTFLLKFSSMLRDIVIAGVFGNTYVTDAYFSAMIIPNAIVLFMLTGMKDAFLPSYYKFDRLNKGHSHLTNIVKGTFWLSLPISIVGALASPLIVRLLYPDLGNFNDGLQIAAWTAALYFLSIALVGVNAVYEGYFDAQKKFSFSTFSQTVVVLTMITFALLFHQTLNIYAIPIGYFVGTVFSFLIKLIYMTPSKLMAWRQRADWQEIKAFYLIFLPVGLTIAIGQINLTVNTIFASRMGEGVVSNLNYAFRLVNIPQAIFGVTIATIVFPILAQAKSDNNQRMFKQGIEKGLSYMFLLLAPTVAGMVLLMEPIVRLFYERGTFTAEATAFTSEYAVFYVGSVLFYSIQAVIAKGFYTLEKGHLMMRIGMISVIVNVIFNYLFSKWLGPTGLALSASLVGFVYSSITFTTLYKLTGGFNLRSVGKEYGKIIIGTVVMTFSLLAMNMWISPERLGDILYVGFMIVSGALIYFMVLFVLKTTSLLDIISKKGGS